MSGPAANEASGETIGERVRRLRLARGLSQRDLSAPGVSYAYVSRIEAGARVPSMKAMRILAERLGVTLEEIETGARVPAAHERELRLGNAELELRLGRDITDAERVFAATAAEAGDQELVARAQAALGLLAFRRSDIAAAVRLLEQATASGHLPPEKRPDVYEALGAALTAADSPGQAVALYERCRDEVGRKMPENAPLLVRFSTYLGVAYSELGDMARARAALADATKAAETVALPQARVNVYWTRAIIAWRDADSDEALRYMSRAIALLEATEDTHQLARAHLVCGQMMNLEDRLEEAAEHLERAEPLIVVAAEPSDLGLVRAEQAKIAAKLGRPQEALDLASEAAELLGDDARHLGLKWHAAALAHAAAGDIDAASECFGKGFAALQERGQSREAARLARDWAEVLREAGRDSEAFDLIEQAMMLSLRSVRRAATPRG